MGKYSVIDPYLFPVSLRDIVTMPIHSSTEDYRPHFIKTSTNELKMAMKILKEQYPGRQTERKSRIQAEINRRERNKRDYGFEKAVLPRKKYWSEDFTRLWSEACQTVKEAMS